MVSGAHASRTGQEKKGKRNRKEKATENSNADTRRTGIRPGKLGSTGNNQIE